MTAPDRPTAPERRGVDALVAAMDDSWGPDDVFVDDIEGMWEPFAAKVAASLAADGWVLTRLEREPGRPDHRLCDCGHVGSVHDGSPVTDLGYTIEGTGRCHGSTDGGKACPCTAFALRALREPSDAR